jgi:hypothetical protein
MRRTTQERVLKEALRLNARLPEHCVVKLLDGSSSHLDFAAMHAGSASLFSAALSRCSSLRRLVLGSAADAQLVEIARIAPALTFLSLDVASSKAKRDCCLFVCCCSEGRYFVETVGGA